MYGLSYMLAVDVDVPERVVFPRNTTCAQNTTVEIKTGQRLPLLTLFTTWTNTSSKTKVHYQTMRNWSSMKPYIIPVIFSNSEHVRTTCISAGWKALPVSVSTHGVPVLKYMYRDVKERFNSTFYAYSNGDILYTYSLINTLLELVMSDMNLDEPLLIVGRRINVLNVTTEEAASWESLDKIAMDRGKLFSTDAEDYFVTSDSFPWEAVDEVVIGRPAYDNWLVMFARGCGIKTIDVTKTVLAVHQTDSKGNSEGHGHSHRDYNKRLLIAAHGSMDFNAGRTDCLILYTSNTTQVFEVISRPESNLPYYCEQQKLKNETCK